MKVKICGIMLPEDAVVATESGADFVGMIFVPKRHRRLNSQDGREIVQAIRASSSSNRVPFGRVPFGRVPADRIPADQPPKIVGNFADQTQEEVNRTVLECGLDFVQLCGQESIEFCGQIDAEVIKVVHVDTSATASDYVDQVAERVQTYAGVGHLVTLDRLVVGVQGGTGHSFDWSIAAQLSQRGLPFLLAGGLSPENVAQAIAEVQPYGVDVSSGVETDGVKDQDKIKAFISNARQKADS